jgi:triosephosphate isomerase
MKKPIVIINLKTYQQGEKTIEIAKKIENISKDIIIGVQASDIYEVCKKIKLKIFAQHVDPYEPGRHTGYIIPESVKKDGATGTFLNHSEHKISFDVLKKTIKRCKEIGLKTAVFASNLKEAKKIEKLKPDYIIYEPPELVAGNISVTSAKPGIIEKISNSLKMPFLVGAGIKTSEDVRRSLEIGAIGIVVSSAITTAKDPEKALMELITP